MGTAKTMIERLPGEPVPDAKASAVAWVFGIAVLVVVAVNALAIRLSPASERSFDGNMVRTKWDLAAATDVAGHVVVIGDSSGNFGVDAAVLGAALGRPAINLCTYGRFQVTGATWFLDEALRTSSGPPALVVAVFGARTFALDPDGFTFAQIPVGPFPGRDRLPHVRLGLRDTLQFAVARVLPLFAQSVTFGQALRTGEWHPDLSRLLIEPDGTSRIPAANPAAVPVFAERTLEEYAAHDGALPTERERAALRALIADADARGYDLVFVSSPIWEGLVDAPEHVAFEGRVRAFLEEACAPSDRASVLDGPAVTFPAEDLENPFHTVPDASRRFTATLVERLRTRTDED